MSQSFHLRNLEFVKKLKSYLNSIPIEQRLTLDKPGTNSLAAWFLGPRAENQEFLRKMIGEAVDKHCQDRKDYFPDDPPFITEKRKDEAYIASQELIVSEYRKLLKNLSGSIPFFSYRYQAHMDWDLTIPGIIGYFSAMLYNQNNVAAEASPVTATLEAVVGDDLCRMLGFTVPDEHQTDPAAIRPWGHITCDGSIANFEAMWSARNLKYFPVSVANALKEEPALAAAKNMTVKLLNGQSVPLISIKEPWDLLNLPVDEVLNLTVKIEKEYNIPSGVITQALDSHLFQSTGFYSFSQYIQGTKPPVVIGTSTKHYSWPKNAAALGIGKDNFINIPIDGDARMDTKELVKSLDLCIAAKQPVIMVVAVLGSTEQSAVDPLAEIVKIRDEYRKKSGLEFVIHVDAAWGGYFASMLREPSVDQAPNTRELEEIPVMAMSDYVNTQYRAIPFAESVTVDPHKAGYIPYPAGGLCYRNSCQRNLVAFLAPEVYHGGDIASSMGVFGIEGSKPGAAPAAVYLSHRIIRPDKSGYGKILGQALFSSKRFFAGVITMAEDTDPFVVIPVQQIPAEKSGGSPSQIKEQLAFIKTHIALKQNNELLKDQPAMELLKLLGSDQIIITYAFNFKKKDGSLNHDPDLVNKFNQTIFDRLSLSPNSDDVANTPIIITMSQFEPDEYGQSFVSNFMKRLGVTPTDNITMNFISSTTMCPWLTATRDGNFVPTLIKVFREKVSEIALKFGVDK